MQPGDKRKKLRRSISYPAFIDLGGDLAPVRCTLCAASQEGAQLAVEDPNGLPNEFILALSSDGAARRRCRVVWRADGQIGVEFMKDMTKNTPSTRHPLMQFDAPEQTAIAPEEVVTPETPQASAETADQVDIDTLSTR